MIIDSKNYNGKCICGKEHVMTTQFCVIEPGCLKNIDAYLAKYNVTGNSAAIYDENTYKAVGERRPKVNHEIILPAENLHANNYAVNCAMKEIPYKCDFLIAIGAGTIHDITRYCAYEKKLQFVSCPTAATVDGFCSSVAAMTWDGFKKTFTAIAPAIVVADLDIISKAPFRLAKSGVGDILGKFTALAEWKIGNILTGEYICERIYDITYDAAREIARSANDLKNQKTAAYEKLVFGLLMSGIAMQLLGTSRCASGAEHHISHLIELNPKALNLRSTALHGEKVGVGALLTINEYKRLSSIKDIPWTDYPKISDNYVLDFFGNDLCNAIIEENKKDVCTGLTKEQITAKWGEICGVINEIPSIEKLSEIYKLLEMKSTLRDIGIDDNKQNAILEYSPLIRNRLTVMRLRRAIMH